MGAHLLGSNSKVGPHDVDRGVGSGKNQRSPTPRSPRNPAGFGVSDLSETRRPDPHGTTTPGSVTSKRERARGAPILHPIPSSYRPNPTSCLRDPLPFGPIDPTPHVRPPSDHQRLAKFCRCWRPNHEHYSEILPGVVWSDGQALAAKFDQHFQHMGNDGQLLAKLRQQLANCSLNVPSIGPILVELEEACPEHVPGSIS